MNNLKETIDNTILNILKEVEDIAIEFAIEYEDHCNEASCGWTPLKPVRELFTEFINKRYSK